jgi:hypothetical protein
MTSIWETTCKCGKRVLKVGCEDHWVELSADGLKTALAKAEGG